MARITGYLDPGRALTACRCVVSGSEAGRIRATGSDTDAASVSSGIPAGHVDPAYRPSTDAPSTSYPMSYGDDWDAVGAYMTTANEMEACVDAVVRLGSPASGR